MLATRKASPSFIRRACGEVPWRLARAVALAASVASFASCSLLLDWNGYTGGGDAAGPDDATPTVDAPFVRDSGETNDASETGDGGGEGTRDSAPSGDAPPPCSSQTCGGCCDSRGFCAGGQSAGTCGTGGLACQNCTSLGLTCRSGSCSSVPPQEAGPPPTCTQSSCSAKSGVCVPVWTSGCCKSDGTCGCQYVIPQPPGPCV